MISMSRPVHGAIPTFIVLIYNQRTALGRGHKWGFPQDGDRACDRPRWGAGDGATILPQPPDFLQVEFALCHVSRSPYQHIMCVYLLICVWIVLNTVGYIHTCKCTRTQHTHTHNTCVCKSLTYDSMNWKAPWTDRVLLLHVFFLQVAAHLNMSDGPCCCCSVFRWCSWFLRNVVISHMSSTIWFGTGKHHGCWLMAVGCCSCAVNHHYSSWGFLQIGTPKNGWLFITING